MIGIYGGTFDPVHFGHLRPAVDVFSELSLSEIRFIPCGVPVHRQRPTASNEQRLAMLSLALNEQPLFTLDPREIERSDLSYMIDTLTSLNSDFPDEQFCLIIGMDAFLQFTSWKQWQNILQHYPLVVTYRPGYDVHQEAAIDQQLKKYISQSEVKSPADFARAIAPAVFFCEVTQLDISSTRIRELVAKNQSIQYLVPESVKSYIQQQALYVHEVKYGA